MEGNAYDETCTSTNSQQGSVVPEPSSAFFIKTGVAVSVEEEVRDAEAETGDEDIE